jgi:hypothetical protein
MIECNPLTLKASSLNKENCHLKNCDFIAI